MTYSTLYTYTKTGDHRDDLDRRVSRRGEAREAQEETRDLQLGLRRGSLRLAVQFVDVLELGALPHAHDFLPARRRPEAQGLRLLCENN